MIARTPAIRSQETYEQHLGNCLRAKERQDWDAALRECDAAIDACPVHEALPFLGKLRTTIMLRIPKRWNWRLLWQSIKGEPSS